MTFEIAKKLYDLAADMDFSDYSDTEEKTIEELEKVIFNLSIMRGCCNFRLLYDCLERIAETN